MLRVFDVSHSFPAASLKTFGVRLEEALVNEITRRKHLELMAAMEAENATGSGHRGNAVQRMFGRMRRFLGHRRNESILPTEFTRRGRRVSSVLEVSGKGPFVERSQSLCPYGVLMVWRLNRNRRGGLVLPQRDYQVLNVRQHLGRSQRMPLLLHFKIIWIFPQGAVSVDSLAELEDGALLMRTLQLSHLSFPIGQRLLGSKRKMSLNPIAQQVPQVVETCCKFIEEHGKEAILQLNQGRRQLKGKGRMF